MRSGNLIVAIDGPGGAGKSTVARRVARDLGYLYIDTGAMFRAVTWAALDRRVNLHDARALTRLARALRIVLQPDRKGGLRVFADGRDVTFKIRSETVSRHTNEIAKVQSLRAILRDAQRKMGRRGRVVMEGRDIGTRVFPGADLKFYLDASPAERARRRYEELKGRGKRVSLKKIAHALAQRDYKDKTRGIAPLRRAPDAIVIDSTRLTLEQVADRILSFAHAELGRPGPRGIRADSCKPR